MILSSLLRMDLITATGHSPEELPVSQLCDISECKEEEEEEEEEEGFVCHTSLSTLYNLLYVFDFLVTMCIYVYISV